MRNDSAECLILGHLDGQELACALGKRTPRPQDHAVRVGIARGDPLGIEITPLMPVDTRTSSRSDPYQPSTDCRCSLEKGSAANLHRLAHEEVRHAPTLPLIRGRGKVLGTGSNFVGARIMLVRG